MGRTRKNRAYPQENNEKEKVLRKKIKELESEIKYLKSELKTLNAAFEKTSQFLKGNLEGLSVEKVIAGAKKGKTMVELKQDGCPDCGAEIKTTSLPFGKMKICVAACGFREVLKDEST